MNLQMHWWLVVVFLTPLPDGQYPTKKIEAYHEYSTCATEADRVFEAMRQATPGDKSYTVVCWNSTETKA
jgi:hypothetical protein